MNILIELFKKSVIDLINNSQLPVGVVELVLKDILNEVIELKKKSLEEELKQQQEQQNEETKEN